MECTEIDGRGYRKVMVDSGDLECNVDYRKKDLKDIIDTL